jgi:hypothetical protein
MSGLSIKQIARAEALLRLALPILVLAAGIFAWHLVVELNHIPP